MISFRVIVVFFLALTAAVVRAESTDEYKAKLPQIFRPSVLEERIRDFSLLGIERAERKDGTPAVRLVLHFDATNRSLFAEHLPLSLNDGTSASPTGPQKINIEIGMQRRLTPVRFVAIGRDGKTEAETWLIQSDADSSEEERSGGRTSLVVCPPAAPAAGKGGNEGFVAPPPFNRRVSLIPGLLANGQRAVDRKTGAAITVGGNMAPSLGIAAGYLWSKTFETVFEVRGGSYSLSQFSSGKLLDDAISYYSFGAGGRLYLSASKGTYFEFLLLYNRRFFIRAAGSGYFAASAFDFPSLETRLGATIIRPKRWGLFTELALHGSPGGWQSNLKPQSAYGADLKLQGVLRHPLAQLRFGPAAGYEEIATDLVNLRNITLRFELALDWEF